MLSPVIKRSFVIVGHKTRVSLEDAFWNALKDIARSRGLTLSDLVSSIDRDRQHGNLSSAIRLFVLSQFSRQFDRRVTNDIVGTRDLVTARTGAMG